MNINKLLGFGKTYGLDNKPIFTGINITNSTEFIKVLSKNDGELLREVADSYVSPTIKSKWLHRVDDNILHDLNFDAQSYQYNEERIDWYKNGDDPTLCTHSSIETDVLLREIDVFTESTVKDLNNGVTIFVLIVEFDDKVLYHFIGRPRLNADVTFTFSNNPLGGK